MAICEKERDTERAVCCSVLQRVSVLQCVRASVLPVAICEKEKDRERERELESATDREKEKREREKEREQTRESARARASTQREGERGGDRGGQPPSCICRTFLKARMALLTEYRAFLIGCRDFLDLYHACRILTDMILLRSATHCNTLQHTATRCKTLQRIATHQMLG